MQRRLYPDKHFKNDTQKILATQLDRKRPEVVKACSVTEAARHRVHRRWLSSAPILVLAAFDKTRQSFAVALLPG